MPHMDGAEVLRRLQALNPGARVLVCSGYSRDISPEELLLAGAQGYLRKPFEMQELASKLRQVERMA
jgi:CheY-like chemotaxis protein